MKATGKNMFNATISATVNEGFYTDAMGNIHSSIEKFTQSGRLASSNSMSWTTSGSLSTFDPVTSRLTYKVKADSSERQWFWYDQAGNMKISSLTAYNATSGVPSRYDDLAYYNTLGQLVGAERRTATRLDGDLFDWRQLIETYRYDPLGRRVVVRGQIKCPPYDDQNYGVDCFTGTMRRTVWAGDQELVEIQRPDSTWAWPVAQSLTDSDIALVAMPRRIGSPSFPQNYDPNPQFGRIAYVHALGLDRPLSFTRFGFHDKPIDWAGTENGYTWPPITVVPHWNSRGEASTGTFMNGAARKKATPHSTHVHEFAVDWELGGLAYGRLKPTGYPPTWNGTLITQKRDLTGTLYRRNRYYDPGTGRFTQPDPIGLAGGLNLYGYAGGDPINFADPFGLCPKSSGGDGKTEEMSDCPRGSSGWWAYRDAQGEGSSFVNNAMGLWATLNNDVRAQLPENTAIGEFNLPIGPGGASGLARGMRRAVARAQGAEISWSALGSFTRGVWEVAGDKGAGFVRWNRVLNAEGSTVRLFKDVYDEAGSFLRRDWYIR